MPDWIRRLVCAIVGHEWGFPEVRAARPGPMIVSGAAAGVGVHRCRRCPAQATTRAVYKDGRISIPMPPR